jgi:hypothetical protein
MTPLLQDFIRDRELADELGLAPQTLAIWRHRRVGPAYTKIGRACWYKRDDIEAWLATQHRGKRVAA